jgi:alpha-mannosidase
VRGENAARDHRLRVAFRTGAAGALHADAAFGPLSRAPIDVSFEERAVETPPPTAPLHRWVSCDGHGHALTLVSDGLAEYEARQGTLLVTLVRAVGELSRPDLRERPGNAGWPAATPEAQCPGPCEASFALAAHAPWSDATAALIERLADDVLLPLTGETLRAAVGPPQVVRGVTLDGDGLACGAVLPAERAGWVTLRCVNITDAPVQGAWRVGAPIAEAWLARLDETPLRPLDVERAGDERVVRIAVGARGVATVLVRAAGADDPR